MRSEGVVIGFGAACCWLLAGCFAGHRLTQNRPGGEAGSSFIAAAPGTDQAAVQPGPFQRQVADSLFMEAESAKIQGNDRKAITLFNDYLKMDRGNPAVYYELALLFGRLQNPQAALAFSRKAVSLDSINPWFQSAYADALADNKEPDSAAAVFGRLSRAYPRQGDYRFRQAVLLSVAGRDDEALPLFRELESETGVSEDLVSNIQRIYLGRNEADSAAAEIRKLIARYPQVTRYYLLLAEVYEKNDQPEKAFSVYRELHGREPENPQALIALALYYKRHGDEAGYERYMGMAFTNPNLDIEDKIAFVTPFLKYIEVDSTKEEEALMLCRMIVKAHPRDPRAFSFYGDMLLQSGRPDSATMEYRRSLQLDQAPAGPRRQENTDDSIALGRLYASLGQAYHATGRYTAADSCFDIAIRLNPGDDVTLNNYSYYLSLRNVKLEQAEQMARKALGLSPGNYVYEDTYAWALFRLGRYREALQWMEKALENTAARNSPGYLEHYGDILYMLKNVNGAVRYWEMARQKGGSSPSLEKKIVLRKWVE